MAPFFLFPRDFLGTECSDESIPQAVEPVCQLAPTDRVRTRPTECHPDEGVGYFAAIGEQHRAEMLEGRLG
jgi:hypothetical protein